MNTRFRRWAAMLCNLFVLAATLWSVLHFYLVGGEGNMSGSRTHCFVYFTVDSNILAALVCALLLIFQLRALCTGKAVPVWADTLKLVGTTAVTVTLMTVVLFLGPLFGYETMFTGGNLYMHLLSPLAAIFSFVLPEAERPLPLRTAWLADLPTAVYGLVYLYMVVIRGGWPDFYGFNSGPLNGLWPLSMAVMLAAGYGLGLALLVLRNRRAARNA